MNRLAVMVVLVLAAATQASPPQFDLAWSEYPSWSTFGVAHDIKMIDGEKGKQGEIEKKYDVDIVLHLADYDACTAMYGSATVDATCITNTDILQPSVRRQTVAILPTSTSFGADCLLVDSSIQSLKDLKKEKVYGLDKSVSRFAFDRCLEEAGENPDDYTFVNMDPSAAATGLMQGQWRAAMVWEPFVSQTLNKSKNIRVMFSSSSIPNEIIDMVVVAQSSLDKPGGDRFAKSIIETYYSVNKRLHDQSVRDDTMIALGSRFANLTLSNMRQVLRNVRFYGTPQDGIARFTDSDLKETMQKVTAFAVRRGMAPERVDIAYDNSAGKKPHLRFDASYIKAVAAE